MSITASILIAAVALHFVAWAVRYIVSYRRFMRWLRRDMALLQAQRDYFDQGRIEEAREIAAARKADATQFQPTQTTK